MRSKLVLAIWALALVLLLNAPAVAQSKSEADTLHAEAISLYDAGRYTEAEPLFRRSLSILDKLLGPDHPEVATSLNNLAALYESQGRYREAEPLYRRSLAVRERALGTEHPDVASVLNNLAELYRVQGRYLEAEPFYKRSLTLREKTLGPDHTDTAVSLLSLAVLYTTLGRYAEAEPLYRRSLFQLEKALGSNHFYVAAALKNFAEMLRAQGRYVEAEPPYKRALAITEKSLGPEHPDVATSLNNLAALYRAQGRYSEAEPLFKRSLALLEKTLGPDHPKVGNALNNLALLYRKQERFSEALPLYQRDLAITEKALGPNHQAVAISLNNLAELYRAQGHNVEAEPLYRRSLNILEKSLGLEHPDTATSHNNLAWLALARSDMTGASNSWRRAMSVLQRRAERGLNSIVEGRRDSEARQNVSYFAGFAKTTWRLSVEANGHGETRALQTFDAVQWGTSSEAAAALTQMSARSASGSPELAAQVRERQELTAEWHEKDKLLIAAKSELPAEHNAGTEQALSDRLAAIDARLAEIDARLVKDFPDYVALASPKPISVADAQSSLRDGEALVLFFDTNDSLKPLPEETFIWVVTKTDMKWVRSDLGTGALQREVTALRCGLDASAWADPSKWGEKTEEHRRRKQAQQSRREFCIKATGATATDEVLPPFDAARAHRLYEDLFGEVEDLIRGKRLLVVPSGPLTQLPLQVLVTEPPASDTALKDIAWLGARQPITVLPSAASLKSLRRDAKPSRASEPFIGFGNPVLAGNPYCGTITIPDRCPNDPAPANQTASLMLGRLVASLTTVTSYFNRSGLADVESVRKLCPLPDSAHELSCVAKSLGAGADSMVIGPAMTEPSVRRTKLGRYRVLHFATHGLLADEMSAMAKGKAEPALVFTPPKEASEDDDGLLTASEITTLKLDADWVVMSACNTAAGGATGAEALSGLAKAFFYAGARALLVSHWPVNSYAATMLTSTTFAELKHEPKIGRAEAFRRAMVALMKDKDRPWAAHPSIWAPFVVVGEGGAG